MCFRVGGSVGGGSVGGSSVGGKEVFPVLNLWQRPFRLLQYSTNFIIRQEGRMDRVK